MKAKASKIIHRKISQEEIKKAVLTYAKDVLKLPLVHEYVEFDFDFEHSYQNGEIIGVEEVRAEVSIGA